MKKAQAAMEFLLSYGWAILAIVVVIAALLYFGVVNPGQYLGKRCHFPQGLSCRDTEIVNSDVQLSIKNNRGSSMSGLEAFIPGCTAWSNPGPIFNREIFLVDITECPLTEGSLNNIQPVIQYTFDETGIRFTDKGSMAGSFGASRGNSRVAATASCTPSDLSACTAAPCRQSFCFDGICTYRITC